MMALRAEDALFCFATRKTNLDTPEVGQLFSGKDSSAPEVIKLF